MSALRRILIVEDDADLRATMTEQILSGGEFSTDEAESAAAAEALLANDNTRYDAILLDIGLPDSDGRDFCVKLRRDGRQMPVIMVTGADADARTRRLSLAIEQALAEPFEVMGHRLRLRAAMGHAVQRAEMTSGDSE